jgi:hypothetical protein
VTSLGWIATGLAALALLVFITILWIRQEFVIAMYWTAKQQDANQRRKQTNK